MDFLDRLVVMGILMENGPGVMGKAPDYILEKWAMVCGTVSDEYILAGLDSDNQNKYWDWKRRWELSDV